jgi:hypothetical protein
MTYRLVRRHRKLRYLMFGLMSFLRAYWRGIGMTHGVLAYALRFRRNARRPTADPR